MLVLMLVLSGSTLLVPPAGAAFPPPQADAGPDQTVTAGDNVILDGSGSRDLTPDETLRFRWDFDASNGTGDVDARGETVNTKYEDAGIYTVTLTVDDGDFTDEDTCRISVLPSGTENTPPKAIIRRPLPGVHNTSENIEFEGDGFDADGDSLRGEWNFGDGKTSPMPTTTHKYAEEGAYHIRWKVTDGEANNTAHTVIYISNEDPPEQNTRPNAVIIGPEDDIPVNTKAFFSAMNSTDEDNDTLTYEWDFDRDDNIRPDVDSTDRDVWWWFNDTGDFTVLLQVWDGHNTGWDYDEFPVTVVDVPNDPPVANAGNDAEVQVGVSLTFRGTATDPDGDDISLYSWDFGDGYVWDSNVSGSTNHTYYDPGTYTATFTVEDEHGATDSDTRTVIVNPPPDMPPKAMAGDDQTVMEGQTVYFSGRGTDDFGIAKYEWDFNSDNIWDSESQYSGNATWTYDTPGVYTAILRVTDRPRPGVPGPGQTNEDSLLVTVMENQPPEAKIRVSTLFVSAGELVSFSSDSTDPEGAKLSHAWDLNGDQVVDSTSSNTKWTYTRSGDYQVTLTVTDDFGQSRTDTITMTVSQTHSVTLEITSPVREMDPGDNHDFRATVTNNGNGDDQFRITLTGKNSNWATADKTLVDLTANEQQTVTIRVSVPASALSTDEVEVTVSAVSNYGSTSDADEITVIVRQRHALKVEIDVTTVSVKQGDNKDSVARLTITNEGNGPDTFRISFSGDITGYLQSSTPKVDLQPGESRDITLSVAVVETAPSGKATGTIIVSSTKLTTVKETLDFVVNVQGGEDDGDGFVLDTQLLMYIGVVILIVVIVYFAAAASRKKRPGNSKKAIKG